MKVYAITITRAFTPERAKLLTSTLTLGRETADYPFDWHLHVNGKGIVAEQVAAAMKATGIITSYEVSDINVGQHPPYNQAMDYAVANGYDYILRIDDDVEWLSKRWLAKLVEASVAIGDPMVLSPTVKGLRWQPPQSAQTEVNGIPLKFVEGPIGGICRIMPTSLLKGDKPYVSDVRLPMGGGDAGGIGKWAMTHTPIVPLAYCQHIRIRHAKTTDVQEVEDKDHFKEHGLFQFMPYIPNWTGSCE